MKKSILFLCILIFILVACAPQTPLPVEEVRETPSPSPTPDIVIQEPTPTVDASNEAEEMGTALLDYVAAYARNAQPEQESLFSTVEVVIERLEERTGTAKDGTPFKALVDPETNTILFIKTQNENSEWTKATIGNLGNLYGIEFTFLDNEPLALFKEICGDYCGLVDGGTLGTHIVFRDFTDSDWQSVLENWEQYEKDLDSGIVPSGYPYNWRDMNQRLREIEKAGVHNVTVQTRPLIPTIDSHNIPDYEEFVKFIDKSHLTKEQILNLLEFTVKTRVLEFKDKVDIWGVSHEMGIAYVTFEKGSFFWKNTTGMSPAELAHQTAIWVKEVDPEAETRVAGEIMFETTNPNAPWGRDYFYQTMLPELIRLNSQDHVIDSITEEGQYWIGEPQNWAKIDAAIKNIQNLGFETTIDEALIVSGPKPVNWTENRKALVSLDNPEQMQAEMLRELFGVCLKNNVHTFGFGAFNDSGAWTNLVGLTDAGGAIFDEDSKPKLAYFTILQMLSERLLNGE